MSIIADKIARDLAEGCPSFLPSVMTLPTFIALLEAHDWRFTDYDKAAKSQKRLLYLCQEQPELFRLYNHAENCILRSLPFDFPSVIGNPMTAEKQHNTQANTPMKEMLQSIFEALIKPLIDAIDRNTASKSGPCESGMTGLNTPSGPTAVAVPAEKPVKAVKPPKPAPAPAPEPEPEVAEESAEVISEARLKATVKTLPDASKLKLKEYFQKKFGYNTMAEIAEEHRADIHAKAITLGATDTDPDAIGDM